MTTLRVAERLAVCSWSLQPTGPEPLLDALRAVGVSRVQIALDPFREHPERWDDFPERCRQQGVTLVSGMLATVGEDYSTLESIRRTGGVVPDGTWDRNWANLRAGAMLARRLRVPLVTFHAGFMPEDPGTLEYRALQDRLARLADAFGEQGLDMGFETGQETAEHLAEFLHRLDRRNVGVNFDPANMILYDKGDPIIALRTLGPWLKQVHLKDANRTRQPGTWGEEVAVGRGQVDWKTFFAVLGELGYQGWLAIEREAGTHRIEDIKSARLFVEALGV